MLRRNFKLGAFLDFCCGVFLLLNKNRARSWSTWFQHFSGLHYILVRNFDSLISMQLKQAGNISDQPTESCSSCCCSGINLQVWTATFFSKFPGQVNQIMTCCVIAAYFGAAMAA